MESAGWEPALATNPNGPTQSRPAGSVGWITGRIGRSQPLAAADGRLDQGRLAERRPDRERAACGRPACRQPDHKRSHHKRSDRTRAGCTRAGCRGSAAPGSDADRSAAEAITAERRRPRRCHCYGPTTATWNQHPALPPGRTRVPSGQPCIPPGPAPRAPRPPPGRPQAAGPIPGRHAGRMGIGVTQAMAAGRARGQRAGTPDGPEATRGGGTRWPDAPRSRTADEPGGRWPDAQSSVVGRRETGRRPLETAGGSGGRGT